MDGIWYYAIAFIVIWLIAFIFKNSIERFGIEVNFPVIMWKTKRLRGFINKIANLALKPTKARSMISKNTPSLFDMDSARLRSAMIFLVFFSLLDCSYYSDYKVRLEGYPFSAAFDILTAVLLFVFL